MAALFNFGKSKTSSRTKSWEDYSRQAPAWQLPYQTGGLSYAGNLLNRGAYGGPYATGANPVMAEGWGNLLDTYRSAPDLASTYETLSSKITPGIGTAYDAYADLLRPGAGYFDSRSVARTLDPSVIASATDNPIINEQIAAGTADIQNIYDRNLADVKAGAAAGGGTGSSWRALLQGDAMESAGRNVANLSSGIRGRALDAGYTAAMRANEAENYAQMMDWMQEAADRERRGGVAGALAGMGEYGVNLGRDALGLLESAGQGILGVGGDVRNIMEDLRAGEERGFYAPWDVLNQYWNIVGTPLGEEGTARGGSKTKGKKSGFGLTFGSKG